jgi:hypothetical protein
VATSGSGRFKRASADIDPTEKGAAMLALPYGFRNLHK